MMVYFVWGLFGYLVILRGRGEDGNFSRIVWIVWKKFRGISEFLLKNSVKVKGFVL